MFILLYVFVFAPANYSLFWQLKIDASPTIMFCFFFNSFVSWGDVDDDRHWWCYIPIYDEYVSILRLPILVHLLCRGFCRLAGLFVFVVVVVKFRMENMNELSHTRSSSDQRWTSTSTKTTPCWIELRSKHTHTSIWRIKTQKQWQTKIKS